MTNLKSVKIGVVLSSLITLIVFCLIYSPLQEYLSVERWLHNRYSGGRGGALDTWHNQLYYALSTILFSIGILFATSLPLYFARRSLYKAWLIWTVVWAAIIIFTIMEGNPRSNNFISPSPILLPIPYIAGSLILLLLEFILSRIKNNQELYEARVMKTLKYLFILLILGTILYNIAFYFEKKIRYGKYTFAPFVTQGV